MTTYGEQGLREVSLLEAVGGERSGQPILVPGASATVDLAPEDVEWVIDLPLSVGWVAHDLVLDKIKEAGQVAAVAALQRRSRAGAALGTGALASTKHAETVSDLEDSDAVEVVLGGLGMSAGSSACYLASSTVTTVDDAEQPIALADDPARLQRQDAVLQHVDSRLGHAQRASKVLSFGLQFVR